MAGTAPRLPEQFRAAEQQGGDDDFHVNELAADKAGAMSPFGPELEFPLPVRSLRYTHPTPADRPNLAEGR
ncbi:MAG: hypothetical protein ACR2LF_12300 [Jatrophihabitantaceae bacterium]